MFSLSIYVLSALLTFFFPLIITVKVLAQIKGSSQLPVFIAQLQFLANYWLAYVLVSYIQSILTTSFGVLILGQDYLISGAFLVIKVWLFYYHGCLLVNRFYFQAFSRCILPLFGRNAVANKSSPPIQQLEISLDPILRMGLSSLVSLSHILGIHNFSISVNMRYFQEFLLSNPQLSFLQAFSNYVCYIDTSEELISRFNSVRTFFNGLYLLFHDNHLAFKKNSSPHRSVRSYSNSPKSRSVSSKYNDSIDQVLKPSHRRRYTNGTPPGARSRSPNISSNYASPTNSVTLGRSILERYPRPQSPEPSSQRSISLDLLRRIRPDIYKDYEFGLDSSSEEDSIGYVNKRLQEPPREEIQPILPTGGGLLGPPSIKSRLRLSSNATNLPYPINESDAVPIMLVPIAGSNSKSYRR